MNSEEETCVGVLFVCLFCFVLFLAGSEYWLSYQEKEKKGIFFLSLNLL
jgi:hypothetical protein